MTVTSADVETVRRFYQALAAGDTATLESCFAPGAVWHLMRLEHGRIAEVRGHYSDQDALDAFWVTR